jgi:YVTN family beta-propeller protein
MKINRLLLTAIAGALFFASCSSDDDSGRVSGAYDNGVIVLNEGGYNSGNASASFIFNGSQVENNIFSGVNSGKLLGDTAQSIGFHEDLAFIVLNVSNKIEVVNRYTFKNVATIDADLSSPRYIEFENGKAYVTNWGNGGVATDDYVAVIDLNTYTVTAKIPVGEGPEKLVEENNKLYVAHKGGYNQGNTISVINLNNNTVETVINVGDVPAGIDVEDNKLYVLSQGRPSYAAPETAGKLEVINLDNNTVIKTFNFSGLTHPDKFDMENNRIYYTVGRSVYSMPLNADTLPETPLFTLDNWGVLYGFAVEDNRIYIADAASNYTAAGRAYIYSLSGSLQETVTVGVNPNGFYFND